MAAITVVVTAAIATIMVTAAAEEAVVDVVVAAEEIADRFRHTMESIYPLEVPLVCSVSIDRSWDRLK